MFDDKRDFFACVKAAGCFSGTFDASWSTACDYYGCCFLNLVLETMPSCRHFFVAPVRSGR